MKGTSTIRTTGAIVLVGAICLLGACLEGAPPRRSPHPGEAGKDAEAPDAKPAPPADPARFRREEPERIPAEPQRKAESRDEAKTSSARPQVMPPRRPGVSVNVQIADVQVPRPGEPGRAVARIAITPHRDLPEYEINVVSAGNLRAEPTGELTALEPDPNGPFGLNGTARLARLGREWKKDEVVTFQVALKVTDFGRGVVVANVSNPPRAAGAPGGYGPTPSRFSYDGFDILLIDSGKAYSGATTFLDLRMRELQDRMHAAQAANSSIEESIEKLKRGGGVGMGFVLPRVAAEAVAPDEEEDEECGCAAASAAALPTIQVFGHIAFQDAEGRAHPLRFVTVQVRQGNKNTRRDPVVAAGLTDGAGDYLLSVATPTANDPIPVWISLVADGENVEVHAPDDVSPYVLDYDKPALRARAGERVRMDLTAPSKDEAGNQFPGSVAFAAFEGATTIAHYFKAQRIPGLVQPGKVTLYYPLRDGGAYYEDKAIHLPLTDATDWDVLMHEYGHYIQELANGFDFPHPDKHSLGVNLCNTVTDSFHKKEAIELAWGEGWPTFLGTMVQSELGLSRLGIRFVGDTFYTDRKLIASETIHYDLELNTDLPSQGEGDEVGVQRVLWDLYDSHDDPGDVGVCIPVLDLWGCTMNPTWATYLSVFWDRLAKPLDERPAELALLGGILAELGEGPRPVAPAAGFSYVKGAPLNFRWEMARTGPDVADEAGCEPAGSALDEIRFFDAKTNKLRYRSNKVIQNTYTPAADELAQIFSGQDGDEIRWFVIRKGTNYPETGDYPGAGRRIVDRSHDGNK